MSVQMFVIHELESAVYSCNQDCDTCNGDAVHAVDKAVAFYAGSLEGAEGTGNGKLMYGMADHRATAFRTAGPDADDDEGKSKVNYDIFRELKEMQKEIERKECNEAHRRKRHIISHMFIPLIQGTLHYAHLGKDGNISERSNVEGATWAASVLPMVAYCSADDASTIYNNMKIGQTDKVDFAAVKVAFENNYECLDVKCVDVGGIWDSASQSYRQDGEPCTFDEPDDEDDSDNTGGDSSSGSDNDTDKDEGSDANEHHDRDDVKDNDKKDGDSDSAEVGSAVPPSSSEESGANVGLAVGVTVVLLAATFTGILYMNSRRKKQQLKRNSPIVEFRRREDYPIT